MTMLAPRRLGHAAAAAAAAAAVIAVMAVMAAVVPARAQASRPIGDIRVFTTLRYPGTPGGVAVDGRTLYVDTSAANFDRPFDGSDQLDAFNIDSARQNGAPVQVQRQYPVAPMGLAGLALDADGRLYAADMNGRIDRIDPRTGGQEVYATIPTGTDTAFPDMPTFIVFDAGGNLYVGDAGGEPIIWRVPPGGGVAQAWFVDPRLAGTWAATVLGITVDPSGRYLYIATGNQAPGIVIYRLPFAHPDSAHLEEFHRYRDLVVSACSPEATPALLSCLATQPLGAGGIAFGASGDLYVVLLSKNQLSILRPDGTEARRFPSPEQNAKLDVPLDGPFDLAFDGKGSLLVSNIGDATNGNGPNNSPPPGGTVNAKNWVVYDVWVNDTAAGVPRPVIVR